MKGFESCLFPFFQALYANILADNYPLISFPNNIKHVKTFVEDINRDHSVEGYRKAITNALQDSNSCGQCLDCQKCSQFFYLAIAELKIPDFITTNFAKEKKLLESEYGKLSFRQPPPYLKKHFEPHIDIWQEYQNNNTYKKYDKNIDNNLIILKGMSSSSPYILNSVYTSKHFTGGGIYLRFNNYGIAIDPGYGFVENMCKYGISIQDIDAVIITHFHIDHTNDMRIIDDLNHQFQSPNHTIKWFIDNQTNQMLYHDYNPKFNDCQIIPSSSFGNTITINNKISFVPFQTYHILKKDLKGNDVYDTDTFGIVLNLNLSDKKIVKIGYTSDTSYYDGLESNLENCKIIIANISGIYYDDYLLTVQKKKHLGYQGCYNILQKLQTLPLFFIISEFWCGTSDLRFDVCKALTNDFIGNTTIIPGDVGLHVNVESIKVKCSQCGKYYRKIHTIRPKEDFSNLIYTCDECLL